MLDLTPGGPAARIGDGRDRFRRAVGIAVLAGLLLLLGVLVGVRGRVVPGDPVAAPVTAPPRVGDCVTGNQHTLPGNGQAFIAPLRSLPIGSCAGPRFGEVVEVGAGYRPSIQIPQGAFEECLEQAYRYLGINAAPRPGLPAGPAAQVWPLLVGPDERQRAAGQDWSACLVYLPISIDVAAPTTVDYSLQGAWQRPTDSRLFAVCMDDPDILFIGNCGSPHRFELVGFGAGDRTAAPESVQQACRRDAIAMLGSPAAFDRGDLTIQVIPARPDPTGGWVLITGPAAITGDDAYFTHCLITPTDPTRRLAAALRGLRDAPVPFT